MGSRPLNLKVEHPRVAIVMQAMIEKNRLKIRTITDAEMEVEVMGVFRSPYSDGLRGMFVADNGQVHYLWIEHDMKGAEQIFHVSEQD